MSVEVSVSVQAETDNFINFLQYFPYIFVCMYTLTRVLLYTFSVCQSPGISVKRDTITPLSLAALCTLMMKLFDFFYIISPAHTVTKSIFGIATLISFYSCVNIDWYHISILQALAFLLLCYYICWYSQKLQNFPFTHQILHCLWKII